MSAAAVRVTDDMENAGAASNAADAAWLMENDTAS
jgi:hypothetical protein